MEGGAQRLPPPPFYLTYWGGGRRLPLQGDAGVSSGFERLTRNLPLLNEGGKTQGGEHESPPTQWQGRGKDGEEKYI